LLNINIKTQYQIEKMRVAGRLAASVLEMIEPLIAPGITTLELNDICHEYITKTLNAESACLYYRVGDEVFPRSICTSVNHVACHGIPDRKTLKSGDIVNIDVTVKKDGYHGDTSSMFYVGECSKWAKNLCEVAKQCLYLAIKEVRPGARLGNIGSAIQKHAEANRYSVVREYCGHGIGIMFHEPGFEVLNYGDVGTGLKLEPGMTFTIEPMINQGKRDIKKIVKSDNGSKWSVVVTKDRSLSAQFEHTLLVTEYGVDVLTIRKGEHI